jgi:tRNA (cmo5U34)-methyltransferase
MKVPDEWTFFDKDVAKSFDAHVREQLPWYDLLTGSVAHIARHYTPPHGLVYDIGASTGNIGCAIAPVLESRKAEFIAIENSPQMAELYEGPGELIIEDALSYEYEHFDLAVCFLVFMFFPPAARKAFIEKLKQKLNPGGAIIVVDKCEAASGYPATILWRLALANKVAAGVGAEEIIAKELSLGGVQRPLNPDILGDEAVEFFRLGEFAGWVIDRNSF